MKPQPVCVPWIGNEGTEYEGAFGFVCHSGKEATLRRLGISTKARGTEGEGE